MAAALKGVGFTVILGIDLDERAMDSKILEFAGALSGGRQAYSIIPGTDCKWRA